MKRFFVLVILSSVMASAGSLMAPKLMAQVIDEQLQPTSLKISGAYIRTMPPGQKVTAAFLTVSNVEESDCQILSATSPLTNRIEFHQHQHVDGLMRMRQMKSVLIAAGETVVFKPGAFHIMFFNMDNMLMDGDKTEVTLQTDQCGDYSAELEVRSLVKPTIMDHH